MTDLELTKLKFKAQRANARLRSLEKAGLTEQSKAYKEILSVNLPDTFGYQIRDTDVYSLTQKGQLKFREDVYNIARNLGSEALAKLETRLDTFLNTLTSQTGYIKKVESKLKEKFKQFKLTHKMIGKKIVSDSDLYEQFLKSEEDKNKSFQTYKKNWKDKGVDITYEQYKELIDDALRDRLVKYMDSDQADSVMVDIQEGELSRDFVEQWLDKADPNRKDNYFLLYNYQSKSTPMDERVYT